MPLPRPPGTYDQNDQARTREQIDRDIGGCLKSGEDFDLRAQKIIAQSPDGSLWVLGVSNGGLTTWTPYT